MSRVGIRVRVRIFDVAAIAATCLIISIITLVVYQKESENQTVKIKTLSADWVFPLSADRQFYGEGPSGRCTILIRDGAVRVIESDCPEKICIKKGKISQAGEWLACLPNKVFISIQGRNKRVIDAVSF
ncbi:MAG: hypothetical protein FVQ80_19430 [Planctomycetes bacterium]|nr:hypothetical protein [Planctomycetota bacterium]